MAATQIQFGLPELTQSTPYWLVLIKLDVHQTTPVIKLYLGADGYTYRPNDHVKCVLRRFSGLGDGLIHYGIKVLPSKT